MAKVLFLIAKNGFRDREYFVPKQILEDAGFETFAASNAEKGDFAIGADGGKVEIDINIKNAKADDFDAVVFVGGPGALKNLDNNESYRLMREILAKGKFLAAICIAPVILAKAGVLKGKKATVWSFASDKKSIEILKRNGALYIFEKVVIDGNIITADGPQSAEEFGEAIKNALIR